MLKVLRVEENLCALSKVTEGGGKSLEAQSVSSQ